MSTTRAQGSLYTKIDNRLATVEFGHPASNAFVSELLNRLVRELDTLSENEAVSLIVLRSEGERAFCAGASFDELVAISNKAEGKAFFSGFAHVINAIRRCKKPVFCRVQGKAVGGGVGLVAACDYAYATEAASIKLSEISVGIAPLVIAPAVARKMGAAGLSELALAPTEWKTAYWAREKGLFAKVFDSIKEMDKALEGHVRQLATCNPEALQRMKQAFWEGTEHWEALLLDRAEASGILALSPSTKQALEKFKR